MAEIIWKERAIIALTSTGASLTNASAAAVGTDLDVRASGNAAGEDSAIFQLTCQWSTVTGIAAGSIIADLYLLPKMDGTNLPQINLTVGSSYIPYTFKVGSFIAAKAPTSNTNAIFMTSPLDQIPLLPLLYSPHIQNRSGQTIAVNWSLDVIVAHHQQVA